MYMGMTALGFACRLLTLAALVAGAALAMQLSPEAHKAKESSSNKPAWLGLGEPPKIPEPSSSTAKVTVTDPSSWKGDVLARRNNKPDRITKPLFDAQFSACNTIKEEDPPQTQKFDKCWRVNGPRLSKRYEEQVWEWFVQMDGTQHWRDSIGLYVSANTIPRWRGNKKYYIVTRINFQAKNVNQYEVSQNKPLYDKCEEFVGDWSRGKKLGVWERDCAGVLSLDDADYVVEVEENEDLENWNRARGEFMVWKK